MTDVVEVPDANMDTVSKNPLSADIVADGISLLARTGNGLSYAYTKLEFHGKNVNDLDILESYPHIRYLDVAENALVNINGISHLEYLLSIDAHGNLITSIPALIDRRKYLQHANFSRNRISSWNVTRWPMLSWLNLNENYMTVAKFDDLSELVHLEIRANRLESTGSINAPKLQRLYLGANQIKSITGLDNKSNLVLLHLRSNALEVLDGFGSEMKKLTYLNLRDNKISDKNQVSKLSILSGLKILVLAGNPIDQIPNYRFEVIARLPKLERLDKEVITPEEREEATAFYQQQLKELEAQKEIEAEAQAQKESVPTE